MMQSTAMSDMAPNVQYQFEEASKQWKSTSFYSDWLSCGGMPVTLGSFPSNETIPHSHTHKRKRVYIICTKHTWAIQAIDCTLFNVCQYNLVRDY